jgi:lipopolysaccharide/colanic/teichoic acid biosynthesis glycosyltransferase
VQVRDIVDRCLAGIALIVFAPLLTVAAVAIIIEDGFPVLFRQQRVGLAGKLFQTLKLRSMHTDHRGPTITAGGDRRITRVGRLIRKYKLDELPQFWNVLRGDMAIIGPRPEIPEFVDQNDPLWKEILTVKPGITNATTLLFRDEEAQLAGQEDPENYYRETLLPLKLRLAQSQIRQRSPYHDFKLICITIYYSLIPSRFDTPTIQKKLFPRL